MITAAPRLGNELRARIGPVAEVVEKRLRDGSDLMTIAAVGRRPFLRQVRECHWSRQAPLPPREDAPLLDLAGALGDRIGDAIAGVEQEMLQMRFHAGRDVRELLAALTTTRGSEAGKIILRGADGARLPPAAAEGKIAGLEHHLEKGVIPADAKRLTVPHVFRRQLIEASIQLRIPLLHERHHAPWRGTRRRLITRPDLDGGEGLCPGGQCHACQQ